MATHRVTLKPPDIQVGKADFEFEVRRNGEKFGRLWVSKGGVVFMPKFKSGKKFSTKRIGWTELLEFAKQRK